jgi:hypothetical protein
MDLLQEHKQAIEIAKSNNHIPGHRFREGIVFCNKCNALLTYISDKPIKKVGQSPTYIAGLHFTSCK